MAARTVRALDPAVAAEVRECLAYRRAAGQDFEVAWSATLRGVTPTHGALLQRDVTHWRHGYERRGGDNIVKLLGVLEDAGERERYEVLG